MRNDTKIQTKPKILCLHGFRTSGAILKKQVEKWPNSVLLQFDFHFIDAPFPSEGKSDVEGIYDPPYFEWFQHSKETTGYENFESCLEFIENYMVKYGPFDGLLGFSQGAALAATLPGLQAKGVALRKVPRIKFVIIISGSKLGSPSLAAQKAYSPSIACPSLHFLKDVVSAPHFKDLAIKLFGRTIPGFTDFHRPSSKSGEEDFLMPSGLKLLESFVEPLVINHPKGHTVPRLDEKSLKIVERFIQRISKL